MVLGLLVLVFSMTSILMLVMMVFFVMAILVVAVMLLMIVRYVLIVVPSVLYEINRLTTGVVLVAMLAPIF